VTKILDFVTSLDPKILAVAIGLVAFAGAIGTIGFLMPGIIAALGAFAFLFSPAGLIIIGIAAVIAAGVLLYKNWDTVKAKAGELGGWITDKLGAVLSWLTGHWPEIATLISGPFAPLVALATDAFGIRSAITEAFGALLSMIIGVVGGAVTQIERLIEKIRELFSMAADVPGKIGNALNPLPGNAGGGLFSGAANAGLNAIVPGRGLLQAFGALRGGHAMGGVIPGPRGAPTMALVHGGETVVPAGARGGGGGNTIVINLGAFIGSGPDLERVVTRAIEDARQKGANF
jgi:hypothetical protein